MTDLTLTEATMLQRFLEDHDGRTALELFFKEQADYYSSQCTALLIGDQQAEALKSAHVSKAYADAMTLLFDFTEKQVKRHA